MSTVICPITTNVLINHALLRVLIPKGQLDLDSDILADQIRTIDKSRLVKKLGTIDDETSDKVYEMIKIYFK